MKNLVYLSLLSLALVCGCKETDQSTTQQILYPKATVTKVATIGLPDSSWLLGPTSVYVIKVHGRTYLGTYLSGHTNGWVIGPELKDENGK